MLIALTQISQSTDVTIDLLACVLYVICSLVSHLSIQPLVMAHAPQTSQKIYDEVNGSFSWL